MANEPIFGREALRRFREEQARKEMAAKELAAKQAADAVRRPKKTQRRQVQWKVTASIEEDAKFRKLAHSAGLTLSNYIRKRCGMPPIRPGRPRSTKIKA